MPYTVDTSNAIDLWNPDQASPVPGTSSGRRGFGKWVSENLVGITEAGYNIACIIKPERCNQGGRQAAYAPPPPPESTGPSPLIIIAVVVVIAVIAAVIFIKR